MKKRLLALALCLVLATSLLPIAAMAESLNRVSIKCNGFEKDADGVYILKEKGVEDVQVDNGHNPESWPIRFLDLYQDVGLTVPLKDDPANGGTFYLKCRLHYHSDENFHDLENCLNASNCSLTIPGYTAVYYRSELGCAPHFEDSEKPFYYVDITFLVTKNHEHQWEFSFTENSVTATCGNSGCPIGKASLTLDAHSVTLPDSPFNARVILKGITEEQIKEEVGHMIGPIRYKFKAPGDSNFTDITPVDGAREGIYQASVTLTLYAQASYALNDDGTANQGPIFGNDGSVTLYTQYTAVNPEVTAQTGDNRPIELMMAGVVVFTALAAAAFILDNKRKYSR